MSRMHCPRCDHETKNWDESRAENHCPSCGAPLAGTLNPLHSRQSGMSLYASAYVFINGVLFTQESPGAVVTHAKGYSP